MASTPKQVFALFIGLSPLTACGGDGGTTSPPVTEPDTVAASVTVISGDGQTAEVGTLLPTQLGVRVTNSGGDPLLGKTLTWTVESGGGGLAGPVSGTDAQGEAVNAYTLGPVPGANTVRAAVDGTTLSATFTATATPAPVTDTVPASIEIVSGNGQSAIVGEVLDSALIVTVRNAAGDALVPALTNWTVVSGDGTLLQDQVTANVAGEIINVYTVSSTAGTDSIEVTVASDSTLKVTFVATATAPPLAAAISVTDNTFVPDEVFLGTGGTATWTWGGVATHNVTWVSGGLTNSPTQAGGSHQVTFPSAGTFDYYCTIHGSPTSGMRGSVEVRD